MTQFLIGAFILVVGMLGNGGALLDDILTDGPFIPFGISLGVFYFLWEETPPPESKPVRLLIAGLVIVVIFSQWSRFVKALSSGWSALNGIGSSSSGGASLTSLTPLTGTDMITGQPVTLTGGSSVGTTGAFGNLSAAQIAAESGGQQFNALGQPLTSSAGAIGISQILPSTAQQVAGEYGIAYSLTNLENNADYNATLGSDYMQMLLKQFGGNQAAALAAYNAGPNNAGVQAYATSGDGSSLPVATQNYLNKILGAGNW
jgi:hypothetical protein